MNEGMLGLLKFAQGPIFRCAFALLVLGMLRAIALALWNSYAAYLTTPNPAAFWWKVRQRALWLVFPTIVLRRKNPRWSRALFAYHFVLSCVSLYFRLAVLLVPAFMAAHVYLWERGLGLSWPAWPVHVADTLALVTVIAGAVWFLGRLYSPFLQQTDPLWTFFKPLILLLPFATGVLAAHPTWSPLDYNVVLLLHILSGCAVFVMVPFTRLLAGVHTRLTVVAPETAWNAMSRIPLPRGAGMNEGDFGSGTDDNAAVAVIGGTEAYTANARGDAPGAK